MSHLYKISIISFFQLTSILFAGNNLFAQGSTKRIVIEKDTVYERKSQELSSGGINELYVQDGLVIETEDSVNGITMAYRQKFGRPFGLYITFYPNGLPKEQGQYQMIEEDDGFKYPQKDGNWYYWNGTGILLKTEKWKRGKLVEIVHYRTAPQPQKKTVAKTQSR